MATHSSILPWRISWTEELGGLQSMGSQRAAEWLTLSTFNTVVLICSTVDERLVCFQSRAILGNTSVELSCNYILIFAVVRSLSGVWLFTTPWALTLQAPQSMRFPRQEYWSSCHFLFQGSSQSRDRTCIFCIGRQILYHSATWEAHIFIYVVAIFYSLLLYLKLNCLECVQNFTCQYSYQFHFCNSGYISIAAQPFRHFIFQVNFVQSSAYIMIFPII